MTHATGDLPDTLTYHDRRWAFIGRTEPADGVLTFNVPGDYLAARVTATEGT